MNGSKLGEKFKPDKALGAEQGGAEPNKDLRATGGSSLEEQRRAIAVGRSHTDPSERWSWE